MSGNATASHYLTPVHRDLFASSMQWYRQYPKAGAANATTDIETPYAVAHPLIEAVGIQPSNDVSAQHGDGELLLAVSW